MDIKIKKILCLIAILITLFIPPVFAGGWGFDINTCQPESLASKASHAWNPRSYWVNNVIELENFFEYVSLSDYVDEKCGSPFSRIKKSECIAIAKSNHRKLKKCYLHSRKMCNLEGGNC